MAQQIQLRRDTAANWTAANPTLLAGEWGFESDTRKVKVGDGATAWASLAYETFGITGGGGGSGPAGNIAEMYNGTGDTTVCIPQYRGSTTWSASGTTWSAYGTTEARSDSFNTVFPAAARIAFNSAAAVNSTCGGRTGTGWFVVPSTNVLRPPARARFVFATGDALTGCRMFVGIAPSSMPSTSSPDGNQPNMFVLGCTEADSQLAIYHSDGTGGTAATKVVINGGVGFPCNTDAADMYDFGIVFHPGGVGVRKVEWTVTNLTTGVTASGEVTSTDIPWSDENLDAHAVRNTVANTTAATLELVAIAGGYRSGLPV